jgi:hypothetical protein
MKLTLVAGVAISAGSVLFAPAAHAGGLSVRAADSSVADDCKYYHYYVKTGDGFVCYSQGPFCIICPAQT